MSEGSARAGAREPELTAGDAAGDLRLKAKANVLNGGVKDQEKKGARRQAGGQKSDDRGQMHSGSRFQVPSPKFGAGNEESIQLTVWRLPFTIYHLPFTISTISTTSTISTISTTKKETFMIEFRCQRGDKDSEQG